MTTRQATDKERQAKAIPAAATLLDAARKAAGLSYQGLADVLGVSRPAAQKYCKGTRTPRRQTAERMRVWSKGLIHLGNFNQPAAAPSKPRKRRA